MKTLFTAAALTAGAALAQEPEITFINLDVNEDGKLSLEEVRAAAVTVTDTEFNAYDADGDGFLQEPEFETWLAAQTVSEPADPGDDGDEPM